ncbi:PRP42 (YDR235W) [Zygosaccharomyces parabailii]|nr:PRP42 (YDR235W) [Zygosaccharomyces parabailii]
MDKFTRLVSDPEFSNLTLEVARFPKNLGGWEKLLNHLLAAVSPLNKSIDLKLYQLLVSTYESLLIQFPYLENYHVDFALIEYRLGHLDKVHRIFDHGLAIFNQKSLLLWISYLKICNEIVPHHKQLLKKYEIAENHIGLHFFAGEFWQLYLEQVRQRCSHTQKYFSILRKVLEIPLYSFATFYAMWLRCVEDVRDLSQLGRLASEDELFKKLKIEIHASGRRGPRLQEGKKALKKATREMYLVVQRQVLEIYDLYESKLNIRYYVSPETLIPASEIELWQKYLTYTMNLKLDPLTHLNFQRALLPLANYEIVWIQYARWLVDWQGDLLTAKNVLLQGVSLSSKKCKVLKLLYSILCSLGEFDQLQLIIKFVETAYLDNVGETDDFELFWDYVQFKMFALRTPKDKPSRYESSNLSTDSSSSSSTASPLLPKEVLDMIVERLSQCESKDGQYLLLSSVLQLQHEGATSTIENEIFHRLVKDNYSYYLDEGQFWSLYCRLIFLDPARSYLEKRRYIVKVVWPQAVARHNKNQILPHLQEFCQAYTPEDIDSLEDLFQSEV